MSDFSKRVHVGCIAVLGNKILSIGFNTERTHPLQKKYNAYRDMNCDKFIIHKLHAEVACLYPLIDSDINWGKISLYIYRIRNDSPHGNARPCPACMQMIKEFGIKHIYFTTDDGYSYECLNLA